MVKEGKKKDIKIANGETFLEERTRIAANNESATDKIRSQGLISPHL